MSSDERTTELKRSTLVGELFRKARDEQGLKQIPVCQAAGLSETSLRNIERGERRDVNGEMQPYEAHTATLVKLALVLGNVDLDELCALGREDAAIGVLVTYLVGPLDQRTTATLVRMLRELLARLGGDFLKVIEFVGVATGQARPRRPPAGDEWEFAPVAADQGDVAGDAEPG